MSNSDESKFTKRLAPVAIDNCGMALAADILMERWTMLIIREAFYGVKRFDDIREDTGIPRSVLTSRLKQLVESGILERHPYRADGARTRYGYVLSDKGRELGLTIIALMQWGDEHLKSGVSAIELKSKQTGKPVRVAFVETDATTIHLDDVEFNII